MDKDPAEILIVFLYAMIEIFNFRLLQKTYHMFLQLPAAFARDDLNEWDLLPHSFFNNPAKLCFDRLRLVKDIVKI
jgi:hypothetical protein